MAAPSPGAGACGGSEREGRLTAGGGGAKWQGRGFRMEGIAKMKVYFF